MSPPADPIPVASLLTHEPWWAKWGILGVIVIALLWRADYYVGEVISHMGLNYQRTGDLMVQHLETKNALIARMEKNITLQLEYLERIALDLEKREK